MAEEPHRRHTLHVSRPSSTTRKLAAIMFTDIVGYTSLMGEDEEKAFKTINSNREIHQRFIEQYHGKIVKELGDGLLSVFENGTEAVQCGIEIQREANLKNIPLRIGIHEGEVVMEDNDVFGDGVNIASRIQDESAKGGICISDSVFRIIKNKTDIKAESIGNRHLKNVDETIKLYQIKTIGINALKAYSELRRSKLLIWLIALIASILLITGGWFLNEKYKSGPEIEKVEMVLPKNAPVVCSRYGVLPLAISPDGSTIIYQGFANDRMHLFKRHLNQDKVFSIPGTENGAFPFFSPDGNWIGFYSGGVFKKMLLEGGNPVDICQAPSSCNRSALWLADNTIVFSLTGVGLATVPSSGGEIKYLTTVNSEIGEFNHSVPYSLPDGKNLLFTVYNGAGNPMYIKSFNRGSHEEKIIVQEAKFPLYASSGHLVYIKNKHLMATPFNLKKMSVEEPEIVLIENIGFQDPSIGLSNNGTLAYVPGQSVMDQLVWVDMEGNIRTIISDSLHYYGPRISPDGNKIALWIADLTSEGHEYIYDLQRESLEQLTNSGDNFWPVWTPDGKHIAFPSQRGGNFIDIYWKAIDKSRLAESLLNLKSTDELKDVIFQPQTWTADGQVLLFVQDIGRKNNWDIMMLDRENNKKISEVIATEYSERHPRLSPDNKWIAYQSDESGKYEIYVAKFPEIGAKWQISVDGGIEPVWSPDGDGIYFRNWDHTMSVVEISTESGLKAGKPKVLFTGKFKIIPFGWGYDIHPDGDKFAMVKVEEIDTTQNHIRIIKNFTKEIEDKFAAAM